MASNIAVFLLSFSTVVFSIAGFRSLEEYSFEWSVTLLAIAGLSWAVGSVLAYFVAPLRQLATRNALVVRWTGTITFALAICTWPWLANETSACALTAVIFLCAGALVPSIISLKTDEEGELRDSYAKSLVGSAAGAMTSAALMGWRGPGALFPIAAAVAFLAPVVEPRLFLKLGAPLSRRWITAPMAVVALGLAFAAPSREPVNPTMLAPALTGFETVFKFRGDRKFDVYGIGAGIARQVALMNPGLTESSVRNFTVSERNGRRRLAGESRRFDLIQVLGPMEPEGNGGQSFEARSEGTLTVEAMHLYFERLKDDGFLQIIGRSTGESAQATLATIGEAWKKSARPDVDLHAVAITGDGGKTLETVIIRMKPFTREERDRLTGLFKVPKNDEGASVLSSTLVSDSSGAVMTDNRLFVGSIKTSSTSTRVITWFGVAFLLALIVWVAMQERRKGVASRWQTASVATYFGGLGMSFAFFFVFFALRAIRAWGVPTIAIGLTLAALFISLAAGATVFAGNTKRRSGVRFQPLASFVLGAMFVYLGDGIVQPLTASASEWISAFVGMSILIPFGLLGGSFLPNAFEEASEKLAPRALSLLWAIYAAGTALGIIIATSTGLENGLDVVFLAGLFCFVWIAIFSGLVRPWNVRKTLPVDPAV